MGQLCLLQATLCLQQAALKLQALQGSNSEVVPSAGKPSQTLCWVSCLSSSKLSIMWLITTALFNIHWAAAAAAAIAAVVTRGTVSSITGW